jgi:hypothetical protein
MTDTISDTADRLMREASGLRRRADVLLASLEAVVPHRLTTGAGTRATLDDLAAAASLAATSARTLDAANMRFQLLGAVIATLSDAIEKGAEYGDAALAEAAGQLRLLLLDCTRSQPN